MTTLKVRFDGRVLVPEHPVDLPQGRVLKIYVEEDAPDAAALTAPLADGATSAAPTGKSPLAALVEISRAFPDDPDTPTDLAAQHDHYLYGTPKHS